jgi:hypothetical protein
VLLPLTPSASTTADNDPASSLVLVLEFDFETVSAAPLPKPNPNPNPKPSRNRAESSIGDELEGEAAEATEGAGDDVDPRDPAILPYSTPSLLIP